MYKLFQKDGKFVFVILLTYNFLINNARSKYCTVTYKNKNWNNALNLLYTSFMIALYLLYILTVYIYKTHASL